MMTWSPSQYRLLFRVTLVVGLITTNLTSSICDIPSTACPHAFANDTRDAFGLFNNSAYVQLGLPHQIPCLAYSYRENVTSPMVVWYKLNKSPNINEDIETQRLITYSEGDSYTDSDRYSLTSNFGLLIKRVEESDGGKYRCEVYWFGLMFTDPKETIDIEVIGNTFPHVSEAVSEGSPTSRLERGRRHTLQCGCASQTPDTWDSVVYWSMGEGVTTDTQIIGARFSDGTTLQIQHGADYSIGSDASLTINSLNDVQDTQRFWCHVFQSEGVLHSCSTDVIILRDQNSNIVLKASPTELYLPEGLPQVLPCRSWTPGDVMCGVQWIHEASQRVVVSYNLSADTMEADSGYDLASDFGLLIESVDHTHAGRYTCYIEDGPEKAPLKGALDTHVIGHAFPPGGEVVSEELPPFRLERERRHTLQCGCASQTQDAPIAAVFWSTGEGTGNTTNSQIIAAWFSDDTTLQIQLGANYSIGSNASLTINSLYDVQDTLRFWCHVFQSNGTLRSCFTDVSILQVASGSISNTQVTAVLCSFVIVAVHALLFLWYRRKRSSTNSYGMGKWPETDERTYTHPELFHNTPNGHERLNVEQHYDFFIGSTNENGHVLLQGRSGSGKTNFLYKLRHIWQIKCTNSRLFLPKIIVLTKALHINEAVRNTKRNISYVLHRSNAVILVDDCNGVRDMEDVLKATKGLSRCQLVMTTRSAKLAQDVSQKPGWRHVTITGFSASSARNYAKIKMEANDGCSYPETQLCEYLDLHTSFESVARLPGFLKRLCEYPGLQRHNSVSEVVTGMLKHMFRTLDTTTSLAKFGEGDGLTQEQNEFLAKCGKVALRAMLDRPANEEGVSKMDFLQMFTDGDDVLKDGIEMGLLRFENIESRPEGKSIPLQSNRQLEKSKGEVSNSQVQKSSVVSKSEKGSTCSSQAPNIENSTREGSSSQAFNIENSTGEGTGPQESNNTGGESIPLLINHDCKVSFVLEIFRDFCAGKHMAHNPQEWMEKIDMNNFTQLANVVVFASTCRGNDDIAREISKKSRELEGSGRLKDEIQLQKLAELCLEVNYDGRWEGKLNNGINLLSHGGTLQFVGVSSHRLRLLAYFLKYNANNPSNLKCLELFHIKEQDYDEFERYTEQLYPGALRDIETECETSTDSNQSDKRMLHTLQSLGLQKLMDIYAGDECYSSISATGLARFLPDQEHLEQITLWGPILGSQQIRDLVHYLYKLEQLKQLDLRLNTQMDGRAFKKIMTKLSDCKALTDLRLSLYGVTTESFEKVKVDVKKDEALMRRLQTLYLLHGRLSQSFGKFLTDTIEYMDNLQCFHVSALVESDYEQGIPDEVVKAIRRRKPDLIELIVDNKDALRAQLGKPQSAEGASTSTTSTTDSHVVDMGTRV